MSSVLNQSDIAEVKDQLSLDFADGDRLNNIGANLGLYRPVFGFTDDIWRALIKELALDFKQVATKFHDVLAVLYGPRVTQVASLAAGTEVGDRVIFLNETAHLPQLGTLVLDEATASAESVNYCFIDRQTNAVYLETPLGVVHLARTSDAESALIAHGENTNTLVLSSTNFFPVADYPYPVVLGRGTAQEEVLLVTDNDATTGVLTLLVPPVTTPRVGAKPTPVRTTLLQAYATSSTFILGTDLTQFPDSGVVKLGASSTSFTTISGTVGSVTVAGSSFTIDRQIGYSLRFDGNVTAALAGKEVVAAANTDALVTFAKDLTVAPAAGDTFSVSPIVEYTSVDRTEGALVLRRSIADLDFGLGTDLELMTVPETVAFSPVKLAGTSWDVIQSTPRLVELLIPEALQDPSELRSAVYLHTVESAAGVSTTVTINTSAGASTLDVADTSAFPTVGVIVINAGGGTEERLGYYVSSAFELTLATQTLAFAHIAAETVDLYEPIHAGTAELLMGDYNRVVDTWPGPYVYDVSSSAPTGTVALTSLSSMLPGPSTVSMTQTVARTALEVEDALSWERSTFPYTVQVGRGTGNLEEVVVNDVNFKNRVATTVSGNISLGVSSIPVVSLSGGVAGDGADFPNVAGYRVLLDRGTATQEVVYVLGTAAGPSLTIEDPTVFAHSIGATVELMADVLSVDQLDDDHNGVATYTYRSTAREAQAAYPVFSAASLAVAELARPQVAEFDVVSATGLDISGGRLLLNFGHNQVKYQSLSTAPESAGATSIDVADGTGFPAVGEYVVTIAPGTVLEETAIVTAVAGNTLTIDFGLKSAHATGTPVVWQPGDPESLTYSSISSNTISFSNPIMLQSIHSISEQLVDSSEDSDPRLTGFDFPLRMPPDSATRLQFLFDLIRAAGVNVQIISSR